MQIFHDFPMIQFGAYAEVRLPYQVAASLAALGLRQLRNKLDSNLFLSCLRPKAARLAATCS